MYNYQRINSGRLSVRFQYRKNVQPTREGVVAVILILDEKRHGPYQTGIIVRRSVWDGQKADRVLSESRELGKVLAKFQAEIEVAYESLLKQNQPINVRDMVNAVRQGKSVSVDISLIEIYAEFMKAKKSVIVSDRRKRVDTQISPTTFESYPKRWVLLQGYLQHLKQTRMPVKNIRYAFATNLKEWLNGQRKTNGEHYSPATVNKVISLLKMLMNYALSKGYIEYSPVDKFPCRGSSSANPKPLSKEQLGHLETCELPHLLRHICDSWLVAGELCLHYSDYMELPKMKVVERDGMQFIQHDRCKQAGTKLKQTVNITQRAKRILDKWGGVKGLYYRHSAQFSMGLKQIAVLADLRDEEGEIIGLQFGQGRDSGLTQRAIDGANGIQLSKMAGWVKAGPAERYVGDNLGIVAAFAKNTQEPEPSKPDIANPFTHTYKAS